MILLLMTNKQIIQALNDFRENLKPLKAHYSPYSEEGHSLETIENELSMLKLLACNKSK